MIIESIIRNQTICAKICHEEYKNGFCAGVMHRDGNCKFLVSINSPLLQNARDILYLDSKYYMQLIILRWVPTQQLSIKLMFFS